MPQYVLNVIQPDGTLPEPELAAVMADVSAVNDAMKATGTWVFGAGLHPASATTVVRAADEETLATDGPYLEGNEHVGGFTVIEAADLDAALDWAGKLSRATTLPIEVRPVAVSGGC